MNVEKIEELLQGKWTDGNVSFRFEGTTVHYGDQRIPLRPVDKFYVFADDEQPIIKFGGVMYTILAINQDSLKLKYKSEIFELYRFL